MYDILWDDVFERFYVPSKKEISELTEEDLESIEECADRWLMCLAGIL